MFYGPGGGEAGIEWVAFQSQLRTETAIEAGVPESRLREILILQIGDNHRLNFNGLGRAYTERQVKRRVKAYSLILTMHYGIPFATRQAVWFRYNTTYRALDEAVGGAAFRKIGKREAVEYGVARILVKKAPTRVLSRFIPYLGWGLAGWDIYTILFRGELWGVQIYEKA